MGRDDVGNRARGRIKYLDGLRGIAALIVVLAHIAQAFLPYVFNGKPESSHQLGEAWLAWPPLNLATHGQAAVTIFFVLSGFVLSQPFLHRPNRWRAIASRAIADAARRYPRLAIPVIASVLICWALYVAGAFRYGEALPLTAATMRDFYAGPISLGQSLQVGAYGAFASISYEINPVLWTMHIELVGSMIVFAIALVGMGPASIIGAGVIAIWLLGDVFYLAFVAGSLLAWAHARPQSFTAAPTAVALTFALGLMLLAYPYYGLQAPPWRWLASLPVADPGKLCRVVGAALTVGAVVASARLQHLLLAPLIQFLGRISFSLYLLHFPVLCSLGAGVFLSAHASMGYGGAVAAAALATIAASIAGAWLMTMIVDEPAVWASRRIGRSVSTVAQRAEALAGHYRRGLRRAGSSSR